MGCKSSRNARIRENFSRYSFIAVDHAHVHNAIADLKKWNGLKMYIIMKDLILYVISMMSVSD